MIQKLIFQITHYTGFSFAGQLKSILIFGVICSLVGVLSFAKASANIYGQNSFKISGILFLSYSTLNTMTPTTFSAIYVFGLTGLSFYLISLAITLKKLRWAELMMASALLLVANTIRHEVFFITLGICLFFVIRRNWPQAALFIIIGGTFFISKVIYSSFISTEAITFLNFTKLHYSVFGNSLLQIFLLIVLFTFPAGLLMLLAYSKTVDNSKGYQWLVPQLSAKKLHSAINRSDSLIQIRYFIDRDHFVFKNFIKI